MKSLNIWCFLQNSTIAADEIEVESLKKECEAAKKKAKDTQEKYFSVSNRLNAIIDEMHSMSFKVLVPREVPFVFVLKLALRIKKSAESHLILMGCLHITGTTFRSCASSPLSVFVYMILPENLVMPERVIPTLVHPRFLHLEESYIPVQNLATSFMKSKKDHSFFSLAEGSACVNFHKFKLRKFRQEIKKSFRYGPRTCASFFV